MSIIQNESQRQIMLSFAYLAYCGELITTPDPENQILNYINSAIPQIPPISTAPSNWQVVWGPGVYTVPGAKYQDNLMFVAQNQSDKTQYAIAIRGTNFESNLNFLMDDFDLLQQMPWPPPSANVTTNPAPGALISEGASIGLQTLLNLTPYQSTQNIISFLAQETANGAINVCVTGHSLGGMLSSTFALYLHEARAQWDSSAASNISCISFAGPSAGNQAFATYSDQIFATMSPPPGWDNSIGSNCDAVRCSLDVATLMFVPENLYNDGTYPVFDLYVPNHTNNIPSPGINFSKLHGIHNDLEVSVFKTILKTVADMLEKQNYTQIMSNAQTLPGEFQPPVPPLKDSIIPGLGGTFAEYMTAYSKEGAYQHSISYPTILNVPALLNASVIQRGS